MAEEVRRVGLFLNQVPAVFLVSHKFLYRCAGSFEIATTGQDSLIAYLSGYGGCALALHKVLVEDVPHLGCLSGLTVMQLAFKS